MKISEYVLALEALRVMHGDLEVDTNKHDGRDSAELPRIAYRKVLLGRESRPAFFSPWGSEGAEERRGEKVVRIA